MPSPLTYPDLDIIKLTNKWVVDLTNERFELEDPTTLQRVLEEVKDFGEDELDKAAFLMAKIWNARPFLKETSERASL